jgi:hypothetical protein
MASSLVLHLPTLLAKQSALQILPSREYEVHPVHRIFLLHGHVPVNAGFYMLVFWYTLPTLRSLEVLVQLSIPRT